jgi:hypothetical protein
VVDVRVEPFDRANPKHGCPPAAVNEPPTRSCPLKTHKLLIAPFVPLDTGRHDVPFQAAKLFTGTPPARVNTPPT